MSGEHPSLFGEEAETLPDPVEEPDFETAPDDELTLTREDVEDRLAEARRGKWASPEAVWLELLDELNRQTRERQKEAEDRAPDFRERTLEDIRAAIEDGVDPRRLARRDDPPASKLSAYLQEGRAAIRSRLFLALLARGRSTVRRLSEDIGVSPYAGSKRFSELKKADLVVGTGEIVQSEAGGKAEIYRPADDVDAIVGEALGAGEGGWR